MGILLNLLCAKWRNLARCLFHLEMLQVCLLKMIPNNDDDIYRGLFFDPLCSGLLLICDLRASLCTLLATQAFGNMVLSGVWMGQDALEGVMLLLLAILILVFFHGLLVYIANLHTQSEVKSNLLGKMQEGVLILDNPPADQ